METPNATDRSQSAVALLQLLETLRTARRDHDWDLSVLCIDTCEQSIERVAAANKVVVETLHASAAMPAPITIPGTHSLGPDVTAQQIDIATQLVAEHNDISFSLDIPWDHLWDDMTEPWLPDQY